MAIKLSRAILLSFLIFYSFLNSIQTQAADSLVAKIDIPYQDSMVRGDVPVFGKAYGKNFKEFILDYGEGKEPSKWILINQSTTPQTKYRLTASIDMTSFGKTIDGNLGTWRTGLDEYEYGEHPVNLLGTHTLRLRVFGKQDNVKEDRITVEVGRIILNSIGGKTKSTDGKAIVLVREHSLLSPFILMSLKPIDESKIDLPDNLTLASRIYELRPPREKFIQEATLSINYKPNFTPQNLAIYYFDTDKKEWQLLESRFNEKEKIIEAHILETPAKYALYGVFASDRKTISETQQQAIPSKKASTDFLFYENDFETTDSLWSSYTLKGAKFSLARGKDGHCMKVINRTSPSPFASIITYEPFDAKKYPFIKFDYKIPKGVKVNFLVKAGGKWFDIEFTDDEKIYWEVNMEKIGRVENVTTDNKWHSCYFNLYDMLKEHTKDYRIEKFIMADWDVGGFMKLEFGHNKKGATYYIDNFIIAPSAHSLASKAKRAFDEKRDYKTAKEYAQVCIDIYSDIAKAQQATLKDFPSKEDIPKYDILNSVALSHFVLADIFKVNGEIQEAKKGFKFIIDNYPFAKWWDSRGWYWEIADVSSNIIVEFDTEYRFGNTSSETLTNKAWFYLEKKDYRGVELFTKKCIYLYKDQALEQQSQLEDFAPSNFCFYYWALNNVGTCYFILGEAYLAQGKLDEAKKMYQEVIDNFYFAQCWEPKGWFWKVAEVSKERISKIESKER
jgi:tetratricopeptide (TPR) repeat protein